VAKETVTASWSQAHLKFALAGRLAEPLAISRWRLRLSTQEHFRETLKSFSCVVVSGFSENVPVNQMLSPFEAPAPLARNMW
jgi:hypothetical protein